jgi:ribonuclease HI
MHLNSVPPQSNKITTVDPGGTSINKIINRAELAGIAAALMNEHTHIATDSAGALWQIRSSILYPQHMKRHKHANLQETIVHHHTIVHHIQLSKDTIHLYKVKAHAGILGNEFADAMAKRSADNQSGHKIHINTDAHPHSSVFWPARVENPPPACLPDTLNTCQLGPPAERLSIFSDLDAVKAHMHVQHNLGPTSKKVSNHQSTNCYTQCQELIKEGIVN